jgi:hypothetical protein
MAEASRRAMDVRDDDGRGGRARRRWTKGGAQGREKERKREREGGREGGKRKTRAEKRKQAKAR